MHFLKIPNSPHASALSADEKKLYIGAQTGNFITEVDTAFTGYQERPLEGTSPVFTSTLDVHDMVLSPNGVDMFITCQKSNEVRVFNTITNTVTSVIPVGYYPQEIVYSKGTGEYFVSCPEDITTFPGKRGVISRISGISKTLSGNVACGYQPHGICVDEKTKLLYVASRNYVSAGPAPHHTSQCAGRNGFVNFIDLKTFTVLPKKYEMSVDPYFIFARP
jgi:YVTN family beta-propeller protein